MNGLFIAAGVIVEDDDSSTVVVEDLDELKEPEASASARDGATKSAVDRYGLFHVQFLTRTHSSRMRTARLHRQYLLLQLPLDVSAGEVLK